MAKIDYEDKSTGDILTPEDVNDIKNSVNDLYDLATETTNTLATKQNASANLDRLDLPTLLEQLTILMTSASPTEPVAFGVPWLNNGYLMLSEGTPPVITSQPSSTTIPNNSVTTLSLTATNASSYQWYKYISGLWTIIAGANSSSYTIPALSYVVDNGAQFRCLVTGPGSPNPVTSSTATITVTPPGANPVESFTYRAGPVIVAAGSNLAVGTSFFSNCCLPVASVVTRFEISSSVTGTVKLKMAVPSTTGGWTVTDIQTLSVINGTNTFTVAGSTLNSITLPAGSMLGVYTDNSGAVKYTNESSPSISEGYTALFGDVNGTVTTVPSAQTTINQLQLAWEATATRSGLPTYFFDENFSGTTLPPRHRNSTTPWTFSAGIAVPGAAQNWLQHFYSTNIDRRTVELDFTFTDTSTTITLGTIPVIGGASTDNGSLIGASISANTLIHYNPFTSGLPTVRSATTITGFTLSAGTNYRLKLTKAGNTSTATITNLDNPAQTFSVSVDNDVAYHVGYCYGAACTGTATGTGVTLTAWRDGPIQTNPSFVSYGDSITAGSGTTDDNCYAQLLVDTCYGQAGYSGDGGTTVISSYRRWLWDTFTFMPKYVLILAGANNANSDVERDLFAPDMTRFIDRVIAAGSIPIVCYVTPNSDLAKQTRINVMNAQLTTILSTRPTAIGVRTDQVLSVGGDGVTWNTLLMADGVHPNTAGHLVLKNKIVETAPQAFD